MSMSSNQPHLVWNWFFFFGFFFQLAGLIEEHLD